MGLVTTNSARRWPDGKIPFEIDNTAFPEGTVQRQIVDNAIVMWNLQPFVRLVPRQGEEDFVRFRESAATFRSPVGKQGGMQPVWCDIGGSRQERIGGQQSKASPALAAVGIALHMVHLGGSSNDIWH